MSRIACVWTAAAVMGLSGLGVVAVLDDDLLHGERQSPAVGAGAPGAAKQLTVLRSASNGRALTQRKLRVQRSRTAFRSLDGDAALGAARSAFPDLVAREGFRARRPQKDMRLVKLLSAYESQVITNEGEKLLAKSTTPLGVRRAGGKLAPVDMTLRRTAAGAFSPRAAAAPVTLGASADDGVRLDAANVTIAPGDARPVAGVLSAGSVFYPNVYGAEKDTDFVSAPSEAGGAQVHWILRSPRASTQLPLDVKIPDGARLRRAVPRKAIAGMPRSIEVHQGEKSLAHISAPLAYDADGQTVATHAQIVGDRIVVSVEHDKGDYRFPIHVDPIASDGSTATVNRYYWSRGVTEWSIAQWGTIGYGYGFAEGEPAYGYGMLMTMPTNSVFPAKGSGAKWLFSAPANTKVVRTVFSGIDHKAYNFYGYILSATQHGLVTPGATQWLNAASGYPGYGYANSASNPFDQTAAPFSYSGANHDFHCRASYCPDPPSGNGAQALFMAWNTINTANISTGSQTAYNRIQGATTYLKDTTPPKLINVRRARPSTAPDVNQAPGSRWRDHYPNTDSTWVSWDLTDNQTGVYNTTVTGAPNASLFQSAGHCGATQSTETCRFGYVDYQPNEGVNTITITGRDKAGNTDTYTYTDRIDTQQPTIGTISGNLWDAREQPTDHRNEGFYDDQASLSVPVADAGSGIKEVVVLKDGVQWGSPATVTNGTANWTVNLDSLADGRYTIEIAARDNIWTQGHANAPRHEKKSAPFHVTIDRAGDVYVADEWDGPPSDLDSSNDSTRWAAPALGLSRTEMAGRIATMDVLPCPADAANPCVAESAVDDHDLDVATPPNFHRLIGTSASDPRIRDRFLTADEPSGAGADAGTLSESLEPWQHRPPGAGAVARRYRVTTSEVIDGVQQDIVEEVITDKQTGLPVRQERREGSDRVDVRYFTYNVQRASVESYTDEFFHAEEPSPAGETGNQSLPPAAGVTPEPDPEVGDLLTDSIVFRELFDLTIDVSDVQQIIDDLDLTSRQESLELFGIPLTPIELSEVKEQLNTQGYDEELAEIAQEYPAEFAGSYIDNDSKHLTVRLVNTEQTNAVEQAIRDAVPIGARLEFETATQALRTLDQLREQVESDWSAGTLDEFDIGSVGVGQTQGVVLIGLDDPTPAARAALQTIYGPAVETDEAGEAAETRAIGGSRIQAFASQDFPEGACSLGYNVQRRLGQRRRFSVTTAGHCSSRLPSGIVNFNYSGPDDDATGQRVGLETRNLVRGRSFSEAKRDGALISGLAGPSRSTDLIKVSFDRTRRQALLRRVLGTAPADLYTENKAICFTGSSTYRRTGQSQCARVVKTNVTATQGSVSGKVHHLTEFGFRDEDCDLDQLKAAYGGDSGGPVFVKARESNSQSVYLVGLLSKVGCRKVGTDAFGELNRMFYAQQARGLNRELGVRVRCRARRQDGCL